MENKTTKCSVCEENQYKYRCPKCRILYCSLPCYKKHKAGDSCEEVSTANTNHHGEVATKVRQKEEGEISGDEDERMNEETPDQLTPEQLKRLGESDLLKELLQNPHLRALVGHLDRAAEKDKAIESAMQEPIFVEFADACLAATAEEDRDSVTDR